MDVRPKLLVEQLAESWVFVNAANDAANGFRVAQSDDGQINGIAASQAEKVLWRKLAAPPVAMNYRKCHVFNALRHVGLGVLVGKSTLFFLQEQALRPEVPMATTSI